MSTRAPLRSMTGFARVRRPVGSGEVVVSVKSVNHRGLDVHLHAPSAADSLENGIRGLVKSHLARGHVDVRISWPEADRGRSAAINDRMLEEFLASFRAAAERHRLDSQPDLNGALRLPGMFGESDNSEPAAEANEGVLGAVKAALEDLQHFREREGGEIGNEVKTLNGRVAAAVEAIDRIRAGAMEAFQARLSERLRDLLKGAQIDPQRLAQEAAILADRSDVGEEVARLRIHSGQLNELLDAGGEAGKKLDFLLQEMNRESNTILSKTGGIGEVGLKITDLALEAKAAIEKIREHSLNLE